MKKSVNRFIVRNAEDFHTQEMERCHRMTRQRKYTRVGIHVIGSLQLTRLSTDAYICIGDNRIVIRRRKWRHCRLVGLRDNIIQYEALKEGTENM